MSKFFYIGFDSLGKKVKGVAEADSSLALAANLRQKRITIISAELVEQRNRARHKNRTRLLSFGKKLKLEKLVVFFRQLSTMVEAGVQLVECLSLLAEQADDREFKGVLKKVKESVEGGTNLSAALAQFPKIFPALSVSMLKAAEAGGNLAGVLEQLATYVEEKDKIDKKIKSASSYPRFILIFFSLVVSAVVFGLVPKFKSIFETFGAQLPLPTMIMISVSNFLKSNILYEVILCLLIFIGYKLLVKNESGRRFMDNFKLHLPLFGQMIKKSIVIRFCKTLATLTKNGVSLIDALGIAGETSNNIIIQQVVEDVKKNVTSGVSLARSMKNYDIFPSMMVKMVAVGEESGAVEKMLTKVSEFYERQFNTSIDGLTSILEPALMIGLGILALIVVISLYLPIFQMTGSIHG